jgi:hypothetical protein
VENGNERGQEKGSAKDGMDNGRAGTYERELIEIKLKFVI